MQPSFDDIVAKDGMIYTKSPNHSRSGLYLPIINGSPYDLTANVISLLILRSVFLSESL